MARVFVSHSSHDNEVAATIFAWLRSQGFEESFLDIDETAGLKPGGRWEQQLYEQLERCSAALLLLTPSWHASKWCFAEFVQARALGKAIFPIVVAPTGDVFVAPDIQQVDLLKDYDGGLRKLGAELTRIALDAQGGFPWPPGRAPYPGMLAFERDDAAIFFGRDAEIRALVERLEARRVQGGAHVVAVLASSGAGKSSLLRAGVLPRLARYSENWVVVDPVRPGRQPRAELAKAIAVAEGRGTDPDVWRALDARWGEPVTFAADLDDLRLRAGRRAATVLVTIDQAEELFSVTPPEEAERLLALLAGAATEQAPLLVVLTLRSDVLGRLQPLAERLGGVEEFSLAPLPLARIGQIVDGPARVAGVAIGPGLVAAVTRDAVDADALPLLAFALRELYDRAAATARGAGAPVAIGVADYEALGDAAGDLRPLENAVRRRADAIVASLAGKPGAIDALREAFVGALARVDDEGRYSRRAAAWSEIDPAAHDALATFVEARLLVTRSDDGGERIVEVAHEALLRKWPRLVAWLDLERDFLLGRQQVARALVDWKGAPAERRDDALLHGLLLDRARAWLGRRAGALGDDERAFIAASARHADASRARSARRRRTVWAAAAAAFVVVATLGVLAAVERRHSGDLKVEAEADLLRQRSAAALDNGEPDRAAMHALAAWDLRPDAKSRSALLQAALDLSPHFAWESRPLRVERGIAAAVLAWTGDDQLVLGDTLGKAAVLTPGDASARRELDVAREAEPDVNMPESFRAATRLVDGSVLGVLEDGRIVVRAVGAAEFALVGRTMPVHNASVSSDGTVVVKSQDEGPLQRFACAPRPVGGVGCGAAEVTALAGDSLPFQALDASAGRVAFAKSGAPLQLAAPDGTVGALRSIAAITESVYAVAFQPGGALLAVGTFSGRLLLVDAASRVVGGFGPDVRLRDNAFRLLAWSPQGDRIASNCGLASACVWRLVGETVRLEATLAGHASDLSALAWNAAGTLLATGDIDARVRVWRVPAAAKLDPDRVALLYNDSAVSDLDVSADGTWLAVADDIGRIEIRDLATDIVVHRFPPDNRHGMVRLDPTRRWVASIKRNGVAVMDLASAQTTSFDGAVAETLAWDRQHPRLYIGTQEGTVLALDIGGAVASEPETLHGEHAESVLALAVDPVAPADKPVVYSADTLGVVLAHGGEEGPVVEAPAAASAPVGLDTLAFSRDGKILVAAGNSPDVFVFDRAGKKLLRRLETGADQVTSAALSPNGIWIVAADNGGRLYVWETATGERWATLDLRREPGRNPRDPAALLGQLKRVAWLPDGKRVAVASQAGAVVIVPLDVEAAIARLRGRAAPTRGARP